MHKYFHSLIRPNSIGVKYAALITIQILYKAPVWKNAIDKFSYKSKPVSVKNIKIAKAYLPYGIERNALHNATIDLFSIIIEEACQFYYLTNGSSKVEALVGHGI